MVLIVLVGAQPECLVTSDSFDLRFGFHMAAVSAHALLH